MSNAHGFGRQHTIARRATMPLLRSPCTHHRREIPPVAGDDEDPLSLIRDYDVVVFN